MKNIIFATLLIYLSITLILFNASNVLAQTMTNNSYTVRMGNLNSISGAASGGNKRITFTSGETGFGLFTGTNFKVRAGFQYINSIVPFSFSITNIFIDFGIISPTSPVTRTSDLTVSNGSAHGFQVTISQNHNLRANSIGVEIPATACDSGPCDPTTSAPWTSSLTYGFGYRCDNVNGINCASGFTTSTYYKAFIASPSAVVVMSNANVSSRSSSFKSTVTYKVNIPGNQRAGLYTNVINYIATPTF